MAADHDDLIFERGIGAGNFRDGVEAVLVVAGEFGFDVHLQRDRHMRLEQAIDAAVVLDGGDDDRDFDRLLRFIRLRAERGAVVVEECSARAAAVFAVAAGQDHARDFFIDEEGRDLVAHGVALEITLHTRCIVAILIAGGIFGELFKVLVGVALEERLVDRGHVTHLAEQDDLAGEFALVLVEVLLVLDVDVDGLAGDSAVGGRRPRRGLRDEGRGIGRGHADPGVELLPAHAKLAPVFEMRVDQAHAGELIARPVVGLLHVGRAGKAAADVIVQRGGELHHMRVSDALFTDAGVGVEVELLDGGLRRIPWIGFGSGCSGVSFFVGVCGRGERRDGEGEDGAGQREERGRASGVHRVVPPGRMTVGTKNIRCLPVARFVGAAPFGRAPYVLRAFA